MTTTISTDINLMSRDGKPRDVQIFSQSGCVLLGFFASSPRAAQFRQWAKRVLAPARPQVALPDDRTEALTAELLRVEPVYAGRQFPVRHIIVQTPTAFAVHGTGFRQSLPE